MLPFPPHIPKTIFFLKKDSNADDHPGIAGGPMLEAIKGEERAFIALVGWESVAMHEVSSHSHNPQPCRTMQSAELNISGVSPHQTF
jgi:hypothetical protein